MKRITLFLLTIILAIGISKNTYAQLFGSTSRVGTTVAQFLKIDAGARAIAMGGAFTAIGDGDLYASYYNPAGVALSTSTAQFTFNHANWLAGMSYDYAAGSVNLQSFGTVFASLTSFRVPQDKVRTFANPEGDGRVWNAGSIAIAIGYSRRLTDRFSFGVNFKYIHESIWNSSASGFAVDVGTLYMTPFNGLMIGAAISNFGTSMQLSGRDVRFNYDPNNNINSGPNNIPSQYTMRKFSLPLSFRIGLSMNMLQTRFFRITGAIDATHPNDNTEYLNSGVEFAYNETFFVRTGYKSLFMKNSEEGLTFGAGIKYRLNDNMRVVIDYGYAAYGRLKNVQFFDLGISF